MAPRLATPRRTTATPGIPSPRTCRPPPRCCARSLSRAIRPLPLTGDFAAQVRKVLRRRGSAQVLATPDQARSLADLLVDLSTEPVVTEYLNVYPRVVEIDHRANGNVVVALELAEVSA